MGREGRGREGVGREGKEMEGKGEKVVNEGKRGIGGAEQSRWW